MFFQGVIQREKWFDQTSELRTHDMIKILLLD